MRPWAGLIIAAASLGGAGEAAAQSVALPGFAEDPIGAILEREALRAPIKVDWYAGPRRTTPGVGTLKLNRVSVKRGAAGLPLYLAPVVSEANSFELNVTRDWPSAMSFDAGRYDVDLTPHAGLGLGDRGGTAEAGARLTLEGKRTPAQRLGVQDGSVFGDEGRWYMFAAASGKAVGLNMRNHLNSWGGAGWSMDASSTLVSDAQLGVGWRKGPMQTSLGYLYREVKGEHMLWGQETRDDSVVAFSLSIKPQD